MSDLLGIATCDECNSRIRILEKYQSLIGRAVRCPKCHSRFVLEIEIPSNSEKIAIQAEEEQEKSKKRRSKSEIRQEHINTTKEGFRALHARLKSIAESQKSSEEQVRVWCVDVLRTALGYSDEQLDTECKVMGGRVDIAIKNDETILLVIECKNIRSRLRHTVREQAGMYAATLSAPWAVITNGDIWKLYRVTPQRGKSPRLDLVFDLALLDEDGVSDVDAEHLYLLSHRALSSGDTEKQYHSVRCTSPTKIFETLFSERVVKALRLELKQSYEEQTGQKIKLTDEDAEEALNDLLTPLDFGH